MKSRAANKNAAPARLKTENSTESADKRLSDQNGVVMTTDTNLLTGQYFVLDP